MTDESTYRPDGSLQDKLDDLRNTEDAANLLGPAGEDARNSPGGTVDPRSSWNREEGLKHDRERMATAGDLAAEGPGEDDLESSEAESAEHDDAEFKND